MICTPSKPFDRRLSLALSRAKTVSEYSCVDPNLIANPLLHLFGTNFLVDRFDYKLPCIKGFLLPGYVKFAKFIGLVCCPLTQSECVWHWQPQHRGSINWRNCTRQRVARSRSWPDSVGRSASRCAGPSVYLHKPTTPNTSACLKIAIWLAPPSPSFSCLPVPLDPHSSPQPSNYIRNNHS